MELRVRHARRVAQPRGQADRLVRSIAGAIRVAEHPQDQRRRGETHDARVVAEPETCRAVPLGVVGGDPLLQMVHARLEAVEHGQTGPEHQVPFDLRARVVVALGQTQNLFSCPSALLELGPVDVEGGEPAQDGEQLWHLSLAFAELQGAHVRVLDLLRVALDRQQHPGQAGLERDLLEDALRRRRGRRQKVEQIGGERHRCVVPTPRVVEQPQAVGEPSDLLEIPLRNPVAPRGADVLDVGGHLL